MVTIDLIGEQASDVPILSIKNARWFDRFRGRDTPRAASCSGQNVLDG
jgi:hypothetical protein